MSLQQGRDHALELHLYSVFSSGSVKEDMPSLPAYILPAYMNVSFTFDTKRNAPVLSSSATAVPISAAPGTRQTGPVLHALIL